MRNSFCLFLIGLLFESGELTAQGNPEDRHAILYSDGSVFQGKMVGQNNDEVLLLVMSGDTLHLRRGDIRRWKIAGEDIVLRQKGKFHYKRGVFTSFDFGVSFSDDASGQIDFMAGYRKNEKISLGGGFGFHFNSKDFNDFWINNDFITPYIHARKYLGSDNLGSFIFGKLGYGFPLHLDWFTDDYRGGLFAQPGVGLHFASRGKFRLMLTISQYFQYASGLEGEQDPFLFRPVDFDYSIWYSRTMFKIGVEFR